MRSSILLALILALFILVSGCQPVLTQQTELSNSLDPIAFFPIDARKLSMALLLVKAYEISY